MKLSTRGRYGLRLMLDLALHYGKGLVLLKDMASRQEISEKYLWHMILPLKTAGLVTSVRGAKGGYSLAKPPADITLKDIYVTLEGSVALVDCTENPILCTRTVTCVARDVWIEVGDKLLKTLEVISLEDLVNRHKKKVKNCAEKKPKRAKAKKK